MAPAPDPIDLSALDPTRDGARFERAVAQVAARALAVRRLRRAVVRRGVTALVVAAAAALVLWLSAPPRASVAAPAHGDLLDWAVRDATASEVLGLGGDHAQ